MDLSRAHTPSLRAARALAPLLTAVACSALSSPAAAQPAPAPFTPPYSAPAAPWTAPPPPGTENLPWVWGYPPPQAGPVWYLAPGAPTLPREPPKPPKPPRSRRDSVKRALTITGAIGFGLTGVGAALAYSSAVTRYGFGSGWETLLIPVAGPFIATGAGEGASDPHNGQVPWLVAFGVIETAFAATLFSGLGVTPDPKKPAKDIPTEVTPLSLAITPTVSSSGGGLAIGGSF